jgi:hypothetical protein
MILTEPPRYLVINPQPTVAETIKEFTVVEWAQWMGATAASATWGYAVGAHLVLSTSAPVALLFHPRWSRRGAAHVPDAQLSPCAARPRGVRHPSMVFAGAIGFSGGLIVGMTQAQVLCRVCPFNPRPILPSSATHLAACGCVVFAGRHSPD